MALDNLWEASSWAAAAAAFCEVDDVLNLPG
eukprot:SAG31_NODE_15847_length_735_cov_1.548742_1_plen_30_part_10